MANIQFEKIMPSPEREFEESVQAICKRTEKVYNSMSSENVSVSGTTALGETIVFYVNLGEGTNKTQEKTAEIRFRDHLTGDGSTSRYSALIRGKEEKVVAIASNILEKMVEFGLFEAIKKRFPKAELPKTIQRTLI